jgi:hypothetical protein
MRPEKAEAIARHLKEECGIRKTAPPGERQEVRHPRHPRLAEEVMGRRIVFNMVMNGFFTAVTGIIDVAAMRKAVADSVPSGTGEFNLKAFNLGLRERLRKARLTPAERRNAEQPQASAIRLPRGMRILNAS